MRSIPVNPLGSAIPHIHLVEMDMGYSIADIDSNHRRIGFGEEYLTKKSFEIEVSSDSCYSTLSKHGTVKIIMMGKERQKWI